MLGNNQRDKMSDYEREDFEQQKTVTQMQLEHAQKLKEMELEITKVETRWTVLFKIPLAIILLPVKLVMAFGFVIGMFRHSEIDEDLWEFLVK